MKRARILALVLPIFILLCPALLQAACSNTGYGTFTCVQDKVVGNAGAGATATATMGASTGAGHGVVMFGLTCGNVGCNNNISSYTLAFTDGAGDSSTRCVADTTLYGNGVRMGAVIFPNVSATTTFTVTVTGATPYYVTVWASEWTGGATSSPCDPATSTSTASSTSSVTSITTSNMTTTNATDLIIGAISLINANAVTPGTGFTEISEASAGIEHEAKSVTSTGTYTCSGTFSSSGVAGAMCLGFKAAAGASGVRKRVVVTSE